MDNKHGFGMRGAWKDRWLELCDGELRYSDKQGGKQKGELRLADPACPASVSLIPPADAPDGAMHAFRVTGGGAGGRGAMHTLPLHASSDAEMLGWAAAVQRHIFMAEGGQRIAKKDMQEMAATAFGAHVKAARAHAATAARAAAGDAHGEAHAAAQLEEAFGDALQEERALGRLLATEHGYAQSRR
jgi:hypothetical protein